MPVKGLTKAEVDEATRAQVASGAKSTDRTSRLPGETATEANARVTAAYKEMTAKPIPSKEQTDAGMYVQYVRSEAGGVGEYRALKPVGYDGPNDPITKFTPGVIPANAKKITGTSLGFNPDDYKTAEDMQRLAAKLASGGKLTADEQAFMNRNATPATTTSTSTTKTVDPLAGKTPDQIAAYNSAKELAQSFVDAYGGKLSDYFDSATGKVTSPTKEIITKALATQNANVVKEVSRVTNANGTVTVTYSDGTKKTFGNANAANTFNPVVTATSTTDTGPTLASNVFKNTLALFFGPDEMTKPWVDQLYKSVSGFYKTGSTVQEAFNMAVLESEKNPAMVDFTKRFKGIYALQKMKQTGKAVTVPTIAEYFATESKMGDMLKASNLGEIANEDFLGDVLGKGVSATEFGNRITQIFDRIDNAPQAIKTTLNRFFPYLDRISLAKALALGDKGATMLQQDIAGYEVLAAGEFQGLGLSAENPMGLTVARASDIAKSGGTYASTVGQFGQIKKAMPIVSSLEQISNKTDRLGQVGLEKALIGKSAKELTVLEQLTAEEEARYLARSGSIGPRGLASQARGSSGAF